MKTKLLVPLFALTYAALAIAETVPNYTPEEAAKHVGETMLSVIISVFVFAFVLFLLVWLRTRSANRFQIKSWDVVVALVPVVLWLLLTGKIHEFDIGEIKLSTAIKMATKAPVKGQISELLPIDTVSTSEKGGLSEIPKA